MKFYRYDIVHYDHPHRSIKLYCTEYNLIKKTPCGYWINGKWGTDKRWVSATARKRFAYPTKKEARINFQARKQKYKRILKARLDETEESLRLIRKFKE